MSNPSTVSIQLAAAISNGIAQAQSPLSAGNLILNGSLVSGGVATMDTARRVLISSTGADGGKTFTIFGRDRSGNLQGEAITGVVSGSPVYTTLDYLMVIGIVVSAATAGAITVGTNGVGSTVWVVDNFLEPGWALAGGITGPAGTTYSLEHTYNDPNSFIGQGIPGAQQYSMTPGGAVPPHVYAYNGIVNASGDNQFVYSGWPIFAHRVTILSGTGLVVMDSIRSGP